MKHLKLIWLIATGRLIVQNRSRPEKQRQSPTTARPWTTVPVHRLTRP
jgi:hypothetical protein